MPRQLIRFACVTLFMFLATAVFAQEFSADMVQTRDGKTRTAGKLHVGNNKARFDSAEGQEGQMGAVIINLATHTTDILIPQHKMYVESAVGFGRRGGYNFFRPVDINNACPDWMKMQDKPGSTCEKVGPDTVNGRSTIKYTGKSADGKSGTAWVDTTLKFAIKWQGDDGDTTELQNIQEGSQPDSLFVIPADYQKMDMGGMMNHRMGQPQ